MARSVHRQKADRRPATTSRLRADIDRGMGRDKVNFPDPAAAPLATDSEAGGNGIDSSSVKKAQESEMRRAEPPASGSSPYFYIVTTLATMGVIVLFALVALATAPS